jgi:cellobiose phosphorylase
MTFFSSSAPPVGYDSDREMFLGAYRDLSNPVVVESGSTQQSQAPRGNNIGCLCHELTLLPGEEREIIYILGVTDNPSSIRGVLEHFHQPERVREAHEALRDDWNTYLSYLQVDTPDPQMNAMLNFWNPVQCRTTLFWSRFVSAYESGLGRGMGTRDSAQDCLGTVHAVPERVRETLATLLHLQFKDGHTWHQVFPLTGEGGPGLASEFPDWPQWFCDDHLWLVMAVCAYLRETGNFNFLDQRISYWDGGEGSVWEHMLGAVAFTLDHLGPHHLPRLGFSDWDDTMNLDHGSGNAESVWCAQQFCRTMLDLSELCDHLGKVEEDARFRKLHQEMARAINGSCWDGAWYVRAFDDAGKPVGTRTAARHQIGLNSQTWAIIGEIDGGEHATIAMDSAHKLLDTPFGLRLMWPAYDRYDPTVRGTSTYPPGAKENGGIFCHAHAWAIIAAAKLGWGERAYQYYRQILPLAQEDLDLYRAEPYVYSQNICAPEHPQYGMGRNAWLTGTAAWTYVAGTQWILGIRPTYLGLKITPVIPNGWQGYTATRIFRGVTYHITVQRIGAGNFPSLWVDGKALTGDTVPIPQDWRKEVQVRVEIGERT